MQPQCCSPSSSPGPGPCWYPGPVCLTLFGFPLLSSDFTLTPFGNPQPFGHPSCHQRGAGPRSNFDPIILHSVSINYQYLPLRLIDGWYLLIACMLPSVNLSSNIDYGYPPKQAPSSLMPRCPLASLLDPLSLLPDSSNQTSMHQPGT